MMRAVEMLRALDLIKNLQFLVSCAKISKKQSNGDKPASTKIIMPQVCCECKLSKGKTKFTAAQYCRNDGTAMCRACVSAWDMRILKDRRLLEEEEALQRRKEKRSKECVYYN